MKLTEEFLREICLLAGGGALVVGIWQIYRPAAWIAAGLMLIWLGLPPRRR